MYGCVDNALIVNLAKKYRIFAPMDIAEEYEEKLCPDATMPINWSRFYDALGDWSTEYAIVVEVWLYDDSLVGTLGLCEAKLV